jgi:hypothetical protein
LQEDKNICARFRCASVRKTDIASLHHQEIIATMTDYAISVCDLEGDTSAEPRPDRFPPALPELRRGADADLIRVRAAASRRQPSIRCPMQGDGSTENHMYIGGILGTILVIALIVYFVRRV